jgi:hypothetical protein
MLKLNATKVNRAAILEKGKLFFSAEDDTVIAPNSVALLTTGIKIEDIKGYKLDIELTENLNDSDVVLVGKTIAPVKMGSELGLIVLNAGRKAARVDLGVKLATYNLIKLEEFELSKPGDLDE